MSGLDADIGVTLGPLALRVGLHISRDELTVVVGPNGAGKTTLLRTLAGLLPVDSGRITLDTLVLDDPAAGVFVAPEGRPVAIVFQDGLLFPHLSARDNVAFGLRARGTPKARANAVADELLARLGVADHSRSKPAMLSGGQAQRVGLARALATTPAMLLLDEPLAALDAATRVETRRILREHVASYRGVRILVTHDPLEAMSLGERIVVLDGGRVVQAGSPDELRNRPASPYVAQLFGTNLLRGTAAGGTLRLENGFVLAIAPDEPRHGPCLAVVEPSAVVLGTERPHASARNTWETVVVDLDHEPGRVRVRVGGPVPLVVDVTEAAVADLGLTPGIPVWGSVKATAISVQLL